MQPVSAIALSGMSSATSRMGASAHNIANLATPGFRRELASQASQPSGGVSTRLDPAPAPGNAMEDDMVGMLAARNAFLANLAVFRTSDAMAGALLKTVA